MTQLNSFDLCAGVVEHYPKNKNKDNWKNEIKIMSINEVIIKFGLKW